MQGATGSMIGIAVLLALVVLLTVVVRQLDLQPHVAELAQWVDGLGVWAPVAFIIIDALVVVFVLPGVLLTLSAGFLFGVVRGTAYVVVGTTIGAVIAFVLSRWLLGAKARRFIARQPRLEVLSEASGRAGWRLVLLTRLVPFFPFKPANYVFGLSRTSFGAFVTGTFVGVIPYSLTNVYVGSLAASLGDVGSRFAPQTTTQWALYIFGFTCAVAAIAYLSRYAQEALRTELQRARGARDSVIRINAPPPDSL